MEEIHTKDMNRFVAEMVGVYVLTLGVIASLAGTVGIPTPLIAAATVGLFVYAIGSLSGAHLNPSVSIGLWLEKEISLEEMVRYVIFQVLGAVLATLTAGLMNWTWQISADNSVYTIVAEALGTSLLGFGVMTVVLGRVSKGLSGIVIGGFLLLGILIAAVSSNGVLNPAVAVGIKSTSISYLIGPIVGAVIGMKVSRWLGK